MENKCRSELNWWAMLASLMTGVLVGVLGTIIGRKLFAERKYRHDEREGFDYCDYDFDDYYDDDLQYRDEIDEYLDETDALSF